MIYLILGVDISCDIGILLKFNKVAFNTLSYEAKYLFYLLLYQILIPLHNYYQMLSMDIILYNIFILILY